MEMKIEPSTDIDLAKKLRNIVKILAYLKKGFPRGKFVHHLQMLLKCGKLAGKAFVRLVLERYLALDCCSDDTVQSYVSAQVYEFSCSSSPISLPYQPFRHKHHNIKTIHKVLKYLDNNEIPNVSPCASPIFESSPMVRQVRVTDSPFSVRDYDEKDTQVDDAAQEFINKFYIDLRQQKMIAALQPPSPYYTWDSLSV